MSLEIVTFHDVVRSFIKSASFQDKKRCVIFLRTTFGDYFASLKATSIAVNNQNPACINILLLNRRHLYGEIYGYLYARTEVKLRIQNAINNNI